MIACVEQKNEWPVRGAYNKILGSALFGSGVGTWKALWHWSKREDERIVSPTDRNKRATTVLLLLLLQESECGDECDGQERGHAHLIDRLILPSPSPIIYSEHY